MTKKDVVKEMLLRIYAPNQFARQHFHKNSIVLSVYYSQDLGDKGVLKLVRVFYFLT
ncbi:hypothetical protein [Holospora curviuscula]|uniref:Uncharacterized protein n=1 Tax=Holospora curviuscula TaxID=1082868 RepID=A0A2S5R8A3_9PROT|nr:hypothetical protein [Holospora curviuscula]PPE03530.1 hypothetical protein HCUR_01074 [Holospora curviuscula]